MIDGVDRWKLSPDQLIQDQDLRFQFWDNQRTYRYTGSPQESQNNIEYEDIYKKFERKIRRMETKEKELENEMGETKEKEKASALNFFKKAAKRKEKLKKN